MTEARTIPRTAGAARQATGANITGGASAPAINRTTRRFGAPGAPTRSSTRLVLIAAAASSINHAIAKAGADQSVKPGERQSDAPAASPMASANNRSFRSAFVHVGRREGGKPRQVDLRGIPWKIGPYTGSPQISATWRSATTNNKNNNKNNNQLTQPMLF